MNSPYSNDLWVDYKSSADGILQDTAPRKFQLWPNKKASSIRRADSTPRRTAKRSAPIGAVRLQPQQQNSARQIGKASALGLLLMGGGGLIATTASTSNVTAGSFKAALLNTVSERPIPTPTFRFDDADSVASSQLQLSTVAAAPEADVPSKPISQAFSPLAVASIWSDSESSLNEARATPPSAARTAIIPGYIFTPGSQAALTTHPTRQNKFKAQSLAPTAAAEPVAANSISVIKVKAGDTFSGLLAKTDISKSHRRDILANDVVKQHLTNLRIGTELRLELKPQGELASINVRANRDTRIEIEADAAGRLAIAAINLPVEHERVVTTGTIEQSLYLAAEKAELNQSTIMALSDIFEWELDFARDIRKGDQFSIVYDRLYRDGKYIGDGDILAAKFVRGDRRYEAVRFTDDDGQSEYYSPDGRSKRRAFMRHPVDVVRITSHFNPNRMHPVLHQIRAHKGVDYGAPHGSPIYATADGKVAFSGSKGAYGRTVILKHGENRSTLYAHMSKIAKLSKTGTRVKRGDIIGYVGKTGRVTGTHLHYEFRIGGVHVDPLKVELPSAAPLEQKYLTKFKARTRELFAQMSSVLDLEKERLAGLDR